jgi:trimeric autotransporter adhesin
VETRTDVLLLDRSQPMKSLWTLALLALALAIAPRASAQCLDWTPGYHLAGIDGEVRAMVVFDDGSGSGRELYAGGNFRAAGELAALNIAKWNGTRWSPVGAGRPGPVNALLVWDDGSGPALWAGSEAPQPLNPANMSTQIARWDGSAWTQAALGNTTFAQVQSLAAYDDGSGSKLYVAGRFDVINGVTPAFPNAVARYDGSTWSAMANGIYADFGPASTLIVHDDGSGAKLFVGGYELRPYVNGPASPVWTWNGTNWTSNGAGYLFVANVRSFAERETGTGTRELYSSGYETVSFTDTTLMRWTGAGWQSVGGLIQGQVAWLLGDSPPSGPGVVYVAGPAYAFGGVSSYGLARWDGQNYSAVAPSLPYPCAPARLALYDEGAGPRLFAGGLANQGITPDARGIVRWDGTSWSTVGTSAGHEVTAAPSDLVVVHAAPGPVLYAAGSFRDGYTPAYVGVQRWNGQTFVPVGAQFIGQPTDLVEFDDGIHGTELYAGGSFTGVGGVSANRIARWDGANWYPVGAGVALVNTSAAVINDMVVFDDGSGARLIVAGKFDLAGGQPASRVAAWDGTSWSALGAGLGDQVYALAVFDDGSGPALFAAGSFGAFSPVPFIARWNGTSWVSVGGGMNNTVLDLHVHDDGTGPRLYASGGFNLAGSVPVTGIARWNGVAWQAAGAGSSNVDAMTSFDDGSGSGPKLYARGSFVSGGVTTANGIAAWDGAAWQPLGAGTDNTINALAVFDDGGAAGPALFACGNFTRAGGYASARIARWARTPGPGCSASTGTAFCAGDGTGNPCPCGNTGTNGHGCDNSNASGGAQLRAEGQAMISADSVTLRVTQTTAFGALLFFQGTAQSGGGAGVLFGDGLRCVTGQQVRLAVRFASAGTASFGRGIPGDPAVSAAGNLQPGWRTRHYQVWYRDALSFCTPSTFNLSNGLSLRWAP